MRLARPSVIVDLNRVTGLDYTEEIAGGLRIGAMTRQRAIERSEIVRRRQPLLAAATRLIAHPQIRNRGTLGGSLAHADPAAEYPAAAMALDAELLIAGPRGERTVAAREFFITYLTTALEPDELLLEMRVPARPERAGWSFQEVARRHGDFALAGAAVTLSLNKDACSRARVVLFGIAPTPVRALQAEEYLVRDGARPENLAGAAKIAADTLDEPLSDVHASARFRRHLAFVLARRALFEAAGRGREAS
jgi:carbon-monoxide dehydrogenase medium subunit